MKQALKDAEKAYKKLEVPVGANSKNAMVPMTTVNTRNILFNRDTGEVIFCDMDNIGINGIPIDTIPFNLQFYEL